jgi:hypothetical protein
MQIGVSIGPDESQYEQALVRLWRVKTLFVLASNVDEARSFYAAAFAFGSPTGPTSTGEPKPIGEVSTDGEAIRWLGCATISDRRRACEFGWADAGPCYGAH